MKKLLLIILWICCLDPALFSQTCASPVTIALCPVAPASPTSPVFDSRDLSAGGVGETVMDYNDGTTPVASLGREIFYKLTVTGAGTNPVPTKINVYVFSNSAQIRIIRLAGTLPGSCSATMIFDQLEDVTVGTCPRDFTTYAFPIAGAGDYYFAIEGVTGATFEIAFGAVTGSTTSMVTYPPTMGVTGCAKGGWEYSGLKAGDMNYCDNFTPFVTGTPVFELCLNGTVIDTDDPLTYVLSGFENRLCIRTYFRNTMGAEGIKAIEFNFGPSLTATPVPNDCTQGAGSDIPSLGTQGPMNGGADNWVVRYPINSSPSQVITDYNAATPGTANDIDVDSRIDWLFWDGQAYNTRGDATGCTSTGDCLMYEFCFDIVSLDNLPANTKLVGVFYPDGYRVNDVPASAGGIFTVTQTHSCGLASDGCYCIDPDACFRNGMGSAVDGNGSASPTPPAWIVFDDPAFPDALPVELISLKAESRKDNAIRITWSTASETNSDYFELQRSSTGEKWEVLTKLKAAGHSVTTEEYEYTDERLNPGIYYYRLKQVDFDGAFEYSKTVSASIGTPSLQTKIYPNPSGANFNLSISTKRESVYTIEIYNLANKLVMSRKADAKAGENNYSFSTASIPQGVYVVKISNGLEVDAKRLIVQ